MKAMSVAVALAIGAAPGASAFAQAAPGTSQTPVVLVDATGKFAARPLSDTIMLVAVNGIDAPALLRPIYDDAGREASGVATWQTGGSVLFTSPDCTSGG